MQIALYVAALLLVVVSAAHSYLGERYILMRLFRRGNLPKLFGGTWFTEKTLRFAWHVTSVAWCGFAVLLVLLADPSTGPRALGAVIGGVFLIHFAIACFASRGRHLSWTIFLAVGILAIWATRG